MPLNVPSRKGTVGSSASADPIDIVHNYAFSGRFSTGPPIRPRESVGLSSLACGRREPQGVLSIEHRVLPQSCDEVQVEQRGVHGSERPRCSENGNDFVIFAQAVGMSRPNNPDRVGSEREGTACTQLTQGGGDSKILSWAYINHSKTCSSQVQRYPRYTKHKVFS